MVRRVLALVLLGVVVVVCAALAASESLRNDSRKTAFGVTIQFSDSVRITSWDTATFPSCSPSSGRAESFAFSGGELASGGQFRVSWTPSTAEISNVEWETMGAPNDSGYSTETDLSAALYEYDPDFMVGARLTSYLVKRVWDGVWNTKDPLGALREHGFEWACVQVRTTSSSYLRETPPDRWSSLPWRNEYWCSMELAQQMLQEAAAAGFRLWLYLNLSDTDTMGAYQHAPAAWADLSVDETAARLEQYTYETVKHFSDLGLDIELYSMSGEIEWGIEDFTPSFSEGGRIAAPKEGVDLLTYVKRDVWPTEARLLKAAIAGVRRADPDGRIILYVAGQCFFPDLPQYKEIRSFTAAFFESMVQQKVDFDIAGFSWTYPYCEECWPFPGASASDLFETANSVAQRIAALGKPVIIAEAGYPSDPRGVPAATPMPGYPYTPEGQAAWVHDLLRFARNSPYLSGFFYFAPDWLPRPYFNTASEWQLDGNSFFLGNETEKPALDEFRVNLPSQ